MLSGARAGRHGLVMRVGCGSSGVAVVWLVAVMGVACATEAETAQRTERSANLSHITGTARKIRMYVKNRFLQLLPDGSVNGSMDDTTDYCEYIDTRQCCHGNMLTLLTGKPLDLSIVVNYQSEIEMPLWFIAR